MKAVIFDLDGVLTETQRLHAAAWEEMFNEFLKERGETPFIRGHDYREYLDGKPRENGIRSFLESRNIHLTDQEIKILGKRKNDLYLELLQKEGPGLISDSFSFVVSLHRKSVPMAVVSSSRNARFIMKETGLDQLIKVIVDPQVAERENLQGKPSPDYFLKACKLLKVNASESFMVEDAISGVVSGKKAGFKKVIGIKTNNDPLGMGELQKAGADEVVSNLWQIKDIGELLNLPHALDHFASVMNSKSGYFLFLDFDGTISEIVENPEDASPIAGIVEIISDLARKIPVCIITGRDTSVIRNLINLPEVYYAACHGFEITGPQNYHYDLRAARELKPDFDTAESYLTQEFETIAGIVIERKTFGLAIHYRMIRSEKEINHVITKVTDYVKENSMFKLRPGEEVIEMVPNLNWDKGQALLKLYEVLDLPKNIFPPLYLGDGKTDEDAFREMIFWGTPILVGDTSRPTLARYRLNNPGESRAFLKKVSSLLETNYERMDLELR